MRVSASITLTVGTCALLACGTEVVASNPGSGPSAGAPAAGDTRNPANGSSAGDASGASDADARADADAGRDADAAVSAPTPIGDASVEAAAPDGGEVGWSVIQGILGSQQLLPGSCSTNVEKLTSSSPNFCAYADVPTLSGTGPCIAKITFADDGTGAVVATVQELAPAPGEITCPADVVAVVPPVTTTITIPLALRADGTADGNGARPGTDTRYTLTVRPGTSLTLTARGYLPSLATRQQMTNAGQCPAPLHDSMCSFTLPL
jgi:hypothetical protein